MANTPLPVQVDYTSRDYASLREDLLARVKARIPEWNSTDPADFGVALVEAFAYMGDLMSYYIDRSVNESSLATATRRASVVALARDLGYTPTGYAPSRVTVTFTNTTGSDLVIPAGTVITANITTGDAVLSIPFETDAEATLLDSVPTDIVCTQGETRYGSGHGEVLGTSNGFPSQYFEIPDGNVIKESVLVYVFDGVNFMPWQRVEHLSDYTPLSRVYRVIDAGSGVFYVQFGDGVSGLVPSTNHVVTAVYRVVDGINGNVPAGKITEVTSIPGLDSSEVAALLGTLTVTNDSPAAGGTDPEELESIRFNGSQAYRTTDRAVSLEDFQNIALSVPSCGKASASATTAGHVIVTVAPYRNTGAAEDHPGFDETSPGVWAASPEMVSLQDSVLAEINLKRLAGTQVSITDPVYSYMTIELTVNALPSVRTVDALTLITQSIIERLDYARAHFGASVYLNDVIALVSSLGVTDDIEVTSLYVGAGPGAANITADADELLLLKEADLVVTVTGGAEGL